MKRSIMHVGVHRTSLVAAAAGAVIAAIFAILMLPFVLLASAQEQQSMGVLGSLIFILLMPAFYFVFGYVFTAIWVWVVNLVAPRLGGIPVTFDGDDDARPRQIGPTIA